jgi:hypothetical protein
MLNFVHIVINWAILHRVALLSLIGGGTGLAVFAQGLLHKLNVKWQINSKAFSYTLVQVLVIAASVSAYLVDNTSITTVYPWLAAIAATVHRYAVSPYYTKKVLPYLEFQASQQVAEPAPQVAAPVAPAIPAVSFVG